MNLKMKKNYFFGCKETAILTFKKILALKIATASRRGGANLRRLLTLSIG